MAARARWAPAALALLALSAPPARAERFWSDLTAGQRRRTLSLAVLSERASAAVVHVRATLLEEGRIGGTAGGMVSVGSGFFIDRGGHVVTNEHVVRGAAVVRVRLLDGRELAACVVGADEATDLALLKTRPQKPVPWLPLADSDAIRIGETAVAIGSPFGFSHSVTLGIVSAKERVVDRSEMRDAPSDGAESYSFFIQTDASINIGNSGGPLLGAHGGVIGINVAYWGGGQAAQGVSFAIPVNVAKLLLPRLRESGTAPRSFLGVDSQPVTAALAEAWGLDSGRGALIARVLPGSPAQAAGLEPGDVVVAFDDHPVASTEDFKIYAQLSQPRRRLRIRLRRNGRLLERVLTTRPKEEKTPPARPAAGCRATVSSPSLPDGFEAADLPAARARGLPGGRGVGISRVEEGAANEAGLLPGDIVLRVGREPVGTVEELRRALKGAAAPSLPLLIRRQGEDLWTVLPRR